MSKIKELMRKGKHDELWQTCCGFIDLNLDQFMDIQKRLLLEQIDVLKHCELGRKFFNGSWPETVQEFRESVPLTTYDDYPELSDRKENILPEKPAYWQHTSGRSTEYPFNWESIKWVPVSQRFTQEMAKVMLGSGIFASCRRKGDTSGVEGEPRFIYAVAPRPYTSGAFAYVVNEEITNHCLPPLEEAEKLPFEERISKSFKQALSEGFDFYFGVSIALVAIGEMMRQRMSSVDIKSLLTDPKALLRVAMGMIKSKLARRPMLPRDLWNVKGIVGSGTDGRVLKETVSKLWGKKPLDIYSCTEGGIIATQTWDFDSMTFVPNLNFLEFIPEKEFTKWQSDHSYKPKTVLLDGLKAGERYEVVVTNFHGGPMIRYRIGDIIKVTSLADGKLGIELPQVAFDGRIDDIIDIGGFIRLTEKVIWQAIEDTTIPYADWTARKESTNGHSFLHVYLELKDNYIASEKGVAASIYEELKKLDDGFMYGNIEDVLNANPVKVSLLPEGAFAQYVAARRSQGADLAHLKPRHINPSEAELVVLGAKVKATPEVVKAGVTR